MESEKCARHLRRAVAKRSARGRQGSGCTQPQAPWPPPSSEQCTAAHAGLTPAQLKVHRIAYLPIPNRHRPPHWRDIEGLRRAIPEPVCIKAAPTSAHPSLQLLLRNAQRDATLTRAPPAGRRHSMTVRVRSNTRPGQLPTANPRQSHTPTSINHTHARPTRQRLPMHNQSITPPTTGTNRLQPTAATFRRTTRPLSSTDVALHCYAHDRDLLQARNFGMQSHLGGRVYEVGDWLPGMCGNAYACSAETWHRMSAAPKPAAQTPALRKP